MGRAWLTAQGGAARAPRAQAQAPQPRAWLPWACAEFRAADSNSTSAAPAPAPAPPDAPAALRVSLGEGAYEIRRIVDLAFPPEAAAAPGLGLPTGPSSAPTPAPAQAARSRLLALLGVPASAQSAMLAAGAPAPPRPPAPSAAAAAAHRPARPARPLLPSVVVEAPLNLDDWAQVAGELGRLPARAGAGAGDAVAACIERISYAFERQRSGAGAGAPPPPASALSCVTHPLLCEFLVWAKWRSLHAVTAGRGGWLRCPLAERAAARAAPRQQPTRLLGDADDGSAAWIFQAAGAARWTLCRRLAGAGAPQPLFDAVDEAAAAVEDAAEEAADAADAAEVGAAADVASARVRAALDRSAVVSADGAAAAEAAEAAAVERSLARRGFACRAANTTSGDLLFIPPGWAALRVVASERAPAALAVSSRAVLAAQGREALLAALRSLAERCKAQLEWEDVARGTGGAGGAAGGAQGEGAGAGAGGGAGAGEGEGATADVDPRPSRELCALLASAAEGAC